MGLEIKTNAYKETPHNHPVGPGVRSYEENFATEPTLADEIAFFRLPKGAKLSDARMWCDDLDTGALAQIKLVLTDGTTTKDLTAAVSAQAAGLHRATLADALGFLTDSHDWRVSILWDTAAGTFQAGKLGCSCEYTTVLDNGA